MQMIVLGVAAETLGCSIRQILLLMKLPLQTSPVLFSQVFVAFLTVANLNSNNLNSNNQQQQVLHKIQALTHNHNHIHKMALAFTWGVLTLNKDPNKVNTKRRKSKMKVHKWPVNQMMIIIDLLLSLFCRVYAEWKIREIPLSTLKMAKRRKKRSVFPILIVKVEKVDRELVRQETRQQVRKQGQIYTDRARILLEVWIRERLWLELEPERRLSAHRTEMLYQSSI